MKSYTDLEQSKKLAEILPKESADMWYWEFPTAPTYNDYGYPMFHKGEDIRNVPCWSLVALLSVLPKSAIFTPNPFDSGYSCKNLETCIEVHDSNPVDACYKIIMELHKEGLL